MTLTPCAIYWFLQGVNMSGIWELRIKYFQKQMQREVYVCLSAIMATGLSAVQSRGKILLLCSISLIYLSVYSVAFLICLQHRHHPFQSNFSRHLHMNHNMYNYSNTSLSCFSISYSCSFVTLLGCCCLLQFPLWLWAHHALLPPQCHLWALQIFVASGSRDAPVPCLCAYSNISPQGGIGDSFY